MQPIDLKVLGDRLGDLAEVFDRKPPTERAVRSWFDVLKEFPTEKVCSVLIAWPRSHAKFPAPNEVWKVVNDFCIADREKKAAVERRPEQFESPADREQASKVISRSREVLQRPRIAPAEHWRRVLERAKPGSIGHRFAMDALMIRQASGSLFPERIPGEDDDRTNSRDGKATPEHPDRSRSMRN